MTKIKDMLPIERQEPAELKPRGKVQKIAEKADLNFPKTVFGVILIAAGVGCNYVGFLSWASNYLIEAGLTMAAIGIGFKIKKGIDGKNIWQNEVNIIKSLTKKRGK